MFLEGTGPKGTTMEDYYEQVLEPVVCPAFLGSTGYDASNGGSLYGGGWVSYSWHEGRTTAKRLNHLIDSIPERVKEVQERKGMQTRF